MSKANGDPGAHKPFVGFRLSASDWTVFCERVRNSGLSQSEFARQSCLTSRVEAVAARPRGAGVESDRLLLLYAVNQAGVTLEALARGVHDQHLAGRVSDGTYRSVVDHIAWLDQYLTSLLGHLEPRHADSR